MNRSIDVYLSISSPFSYLAWTRLPALAQRSGCEYRYHLIDLARVWEQSDNPGPVSVESKLNYLITDAGRWAERYGVPLNLPGEFVFDNTPSCRVFEVVRESGGEIPYIDSLMTSYWVGGQNFAKPDVLASCAAKAGVGEEKVTQALNDDATLEASRQEAEQAVSQGIFGVPSFVVDGDLYWGNDRLDFLERRLAC